MNTEKNLLQKFKIKDLEFETLFKVNLQLKFFIILFKKLILNQLFSQCNRHILCTKFKKQQKLQESEKLVTVFFFK